MAKVQVSSILRALQILECFMDRETEWTLKELVDHLDLPSTTVFRQVSTLAERQLCSLAHIFTNDNLGRSFLNNRSAKFSAGHGDLCL